MNPIDDAKFDELLKQHNVTPQANTGGVDPWADFGPATPQFDPQGRKMTPEKIQNQQLEQGLRQDIVNSAKDTLVKPFTDRFSEIDKGDHSAEGSAFLKGGAVIGDATDIVMQGFKGAAQLVLPKSAEDAIGSAYDKAMPTLSEEQKSKIGELIKAHPDIADYLGATLNYASVIPVVKPFAKVVNEGINMAKPIVKAGIEKQAAKRTVNLEENAIKNATPDPATLTPTQYDKLIEQNKITPKGIKTPAKYIMSPEEETVARKNSDILQDKDPIKNSININNKLDSKDKEVGKFLAENNTPIDPLKMKVYLTDKMKDITDIMVPEARLNKSKQTMINNFVDGLKEKDVTTAWQNRKEFDAYIDNAFKGSPSLAKDMKKGLRNGVQDFIAENTPDTVYKGHMKEMTQLYNLRDVMVDKAGAEKGKNAIQSWIKANPAKAKTIGWGTTAAGAGIGWDIMH